MTNNALSFTQFTIRSKPNWPTGHRPDAYVGKIIEKLESTGLYDDTVIVAFTDVYGRLLGKRFDAAFFLDSIDANTPGASAKPHRLKL